MRSRLASLLLAATVLSSAFCANVAFAGEIVGHVTADADGVSLAGAEVQIVELGRKTFTENDGSFRFSDVPAGSYTLKVTYAGSAPSEQKFEVPATGAVTADISLDGVQGEKVVVIGQRGQLASSVSRQRAADGVQSVATRDSIGQFPDQNVAESVRRLPGVNVLNDQGEGRFVAVRGLDPNLNSASIDGVRTPSPESDVRSVALDVIPSELIDSIEVKKSLTPDMDADTIGASIQINTTSSLTRKKPFYSARLEGSYNDLNGQWSPKAGVDFSTKITEQLGVAGGLSYYRRKFETDNVEADGWGEEGGINYADTIEYRDYDVTRKRIGGSLSFDYRMDDHTDLFLKGLYSKFDDQEYRRRVIFDMEDAVPNSGSATTASFDSADGERFTVIRDLKDRFESQTIASVVFGGKSSFDPWFFEYSASYAKAQEKEDGSLDPGRFRQRFDGAAGAADQGAVTFDYSDLGKPSFVFGTGVDNFLDPSLYGFYRLEETDLSLSEDEEYAIKADITRTFVVGEDALFDVKFGGKARLREKSYDLQLNYFDGYDGDFTLADIAGPSTYRIAAIDPVPGKYSLADFFGANHANFELSDLDTAFESAVADFLVDEDIYAGYLMGRYESDRLRAIGGIRVEHTEDDLNGSLVELVEEGVEHNGVAVDDDTVFVTPVNFSKTYTDWLPSAVVRYEAADDLIVRLGGFRSVVRPNIGQIAPRFIIEDTEDDGREGEFGNPALDPYRAWNVDFSVEWYFAREAVISGGVFYKTIKDFIVEAEFEDGVFNGVAYNEAVIPINGDKAEVRGFEFNYQQSLLFLPEPFDGLLASFNYTYTDAEGDVLGRTIPLPASSKNTYTALLGYEKGPLSLRVAATYRDKYLDELGGDAESDRYVKDHLQWDFTAKYRVLDHVQLVGELANINDEPYLAYQRGPNGDRLLQYEEYSWTGKVGVRVAY
jgi:TonB-dependent receptor